MLHLNNQQIHGLEHSSCLYTRSLHPVFICPANSYLDIPAMYRLIYCPFALIHTDSCTSLREIPASFFILPVPNRIAYMTAFLCALKILYPGVAHRLDTYLIRYQKNQSNYSDTYLSTVGILA